MAVVMAPDGFALRIRSIAPSFRRAGLEFTREPTIVQAASISPAQAIAILAETELLVETGEPEDDAGFASVLPEKSERMLDALRQAAQDGAGSCAEVIFADLKAEDDASDPADPATTKPASKSPKGRKASAAKSSPGS